MYTTLFNINIYHSYFLDEGERSFFELNGGNNGVTPLTEKEKKVLERHYDIADYLTIVPAQETKDKLKNHRLLLRNHAKGIRILNETIQETAEENNVEVTRYSPIITLSETLTFTFYIKVHDAYFENYSKIVEKNQHQLYLLSNKNTTVTNIFETTSEVKKWEEFLLTVKETRKLLLEIEKEKQSKILLPSLVTIANISTTVLEAIETKIENAVSLSKEEEESIQAINSYIQATKNKGVIGVLQLQINGANNTDLVEEVLVKNPENQQFDIQKQCLLATPPEFSICIENRTTFWRYKKTSENLVMTTKEEKPLTKNGRVEIEKQDVQPQPQEDYYFPNPTPEIIKKEAQSYYSEVFI